MTPDDAMLWCRLCELMYPAANTFCPVHRGAELVPLPAGAGTGETAADTQDEDPQRARTMCWNCGGRTKDATNTTCAECHESLVPPALVIDFPAGPVVVRARGTSAELGRAGLFGHVFRAYPNVSRWHATVSVDERGDAWLTPNPRAPNGTFVNGCEIFARTPMRPGDQIRFATDHGPQPGPVSERIRLPQAD